MMEIVDFAAIHTRIAPFLRDTPVLDISDVGLGPVTLKLDLLQPTGSFKVRGAANSLTSGAIPAAGIVAASGGNHGAAVAYVAQKLGAKVTIFAPDYASPTKIERMRDLGARIEFRPGFDAALAGAKDFVAEHGAFFVHPYDTRATIEGQGTCAYEFVRQAAFDTLLVGVGGGGLASGCALALPAQKKLVCVETEGTNGLHLALGAGRPVTITPTGLSADSLGAQQIGALCFDILQTRKVQSIVVTDDHVRTAQRFLWDKTRLISEPGGATAFAALTAGVYKPAPGERVGVILCGANTDPARLFNTPSPVS